MAAYNAEIYDIKFHTLHFQDLGKANHAMPMLALKIFASTVLFLYPELVCYHSHRTTRYMVECSFCNHTFLNPNPSFASKKT